MVPVASEPIQAFQWALENLSPAEVIRSSQVRDSFQRFLQRGTTSQLRQLQLTAQDLSNPSTIIDSDEHHTLEEHYDTVSSRASVSHGYSRGSKRRRASSDQPCYPQSVSKRYRRTGSIELSTPEPVPSDMASVSPAPSISLSDSVVSVPSTPRPSSAHNYPGSHGLPPDRSSDDESILSMGISETSHSGILSDAAKFFEARLGTRIKRLHYLVRAVQGFLEAPQLEHGFAKAMWCSRSAIFRKPQMADSHARLRNLYDGHRRIKQAREQYLYAARFCYIYLEHDLEELSKSQALVLSQGRGRMTAAFEVQAKIISTSVDVVKAERKAGRGYLQLLLEGGPGFILRLGCNVSTIWERKLSVSDISLIIEYLKTQLPDLYENIKSHDKLATQALLEGFVAYGWTKPEILSSTSQLFAALKQYVNMEDIISDEIMEDPSLNLSDLTPIASHGTPSHCSFEDNPTPGTVDFDMGSSDTSFSDSCFAAGEENFCTQNLYFSYPQLRTEISEMTDAELESWMSMGAMNTSQLDGTINTQNDANLLGWDGSFDKHNLAFTDPSFMNDSFATYM